MKRLLRPGACMFGLSPKPMFLTVDRNFGTKECEHVWTMLQKAECAIFKCCSNFGKIHITQGNPMPSIEYTFQRNPISVKLCEVNNLVCCKAQGKVTWDEQPTVLSYHGFLNQGSGRLGTGDGHTNEIAHVSSAAPNLRLNPGFNGSRGRSQS